MYNGINSLLLSLKGRRKEEVKAGEERELEGQREKGTVHQCSKAQEHFFGTRNLFLLLPPCNLLDIKHSCIIYETLETQCGCDY